MGKKQKVFMIPDDRLSHLFLSGSCLLGFHNLKKISGILVEIVMYEISCRLVEVRVLKKSLLAFTMF